MDCITQIESMIREFFRSIDPSDWRKLERKTQFVTDIGQLLERMKNVVVRPGILPESPKVLCEVLTNICERFAKGSNDYNEIFLTGNCIIIADCWYAVVSSGQH